MFDCPDTIGIKTLTTLSDIEGLSKQWAMLLSESTCNITFSSFTWYKYSVTICGDYIPRLIVAFLGQKLVGIFPLCIQQSDERVTFPNSALTDYHDIIVEDSIMGHGICTAMVKYLFSSSNSTKHSTVVFTNVRSDGNLMKGLNLLFSKEQLNNFTFVTTNCFYTNLHQDYDTYISTRKKSHKKQIRTAQRKAKNNNLSLALLEPVPQNALIVSEVFLRLHLQRRKHTSCFMITSNSRFFDMAIPELFVEGKVVVFALFHTEKFIAINIRLKGTNSLCAWNTGFDVNYSRFSPGRLLRAYEFQHAYSLGMSEYDFLRGTQDHKKPWADGIRKIFSLSIDLTKMDCPNSSSTECTRTNF